MVLSTGGVYAQPTGSTVSIYADPGISPDGTELAFVSGGDIWTVAAGGGEARLLVSHPAYDARPIYSPDGKSLAFVSTRTGNGDIYVLSLGTGKLLRITFDDGYEELSGWSADGKYLYFHSSANDIAGMNDIWIVPVDGGSPLPLSADRYATEYHGAESPDGKTLAFVGRGMAAGQWWRKGSSHLDQTELWLLELKQKLSPSAYKPLGQGKARKVWPMWAADGKGLYYVSDQNGHQNLWYSDLQGQEQALTDFKTGRVLWPSIANKAGKIAFERDFKIWLYDTNTKQAAPVNITLKGVGNREMVNLEQLNSGFSNLRVSPDGKKVAFIAHGELFASSSTTGGEAIRVTNTLAIEANPVWTKDSKKLIFTSYGPEGGKLWQYDFSTRKLSEIAVEKGDLSSLVLSPNGLYLAYLRNTKQVIVLDLESKREQVLYEGYLGRMSFSGNESIAWSPDNQWLAFANYDENAIRNIWVVPRQGGESKPVSFLANTFGNGPEWSADGKYIYFGTSQRTENARIARIELKAGTKAFKEDAFYELFDAAKSDKTKGTAADKKDSSNVEIAFEHIRDRLTLLPFDVSIGSYVISHDGKKMAFTTNQLGQQSLFLYPLDEAQDNPRPQLLQSARGGKNALQFTADDKQLYYLQGGSIQYLNLTGDHTPKTLATNVQMEVDFEQEKQLLVYQTWDVLNKGFYDPHFHGVDWNGVLKNYQEVVQGVQTPEELRRMLNLMVGELNASHMGVSASGGQRSSTARLGLDFDVKEYLDKGHFQVSAIVAGGPADIAGNIGVGDILLAIDGQQLDSRTNIGQLLENKLGKKVVLTLQTGKEVALLPVNLMAEKQLRYRQWVASQRDYVAQKSDGRLGYVHMLNMSAEALEQLYIDLDAQNLTKEGVIIDIRNNNGGFVNAYALDVFARRPYLTMTGRDMPAAPARLQLGQRALQKPTVLLINQHSLSDAEDFTEGYKAMKLGTVVGEPTAGWIIFTSAAQLLDGSSIRLPFSRITDHEGKDMELNPRQPDVYSHRPMGESYGGQSVQLDKAIDELLKATGK